MQHHHGPLPHHHYTTATRRHHHHGSLTTANTPTATAAALWQPAPPRRHLLHHHRNYSPPATTAGAAATAAVFPAAAVDVAGCGWQNSHHHHGGANTKSDFYPLGCPPPNHHRGGGRTTVQPPQSHLVVSGLWWYMLASFDGTERGYRKTWIGWEINVYGHKMYKLVKKMKALKHKLKEISWKNGNISEYVDKYRKELKIVQENLDLQPHNKDVKEKEVHALDVYHKAIDEEESFLFQKVKVDWISMGIIHSSVTQDQISIPHWSQSFTYLDSGLFKRIVDHGNSRLSMSSRKPGLSKKYEISTLTKSQLPPLVIKMPSQTKETKCQILPLLATVSDDSNDDNKEYKEEDGWDTFQSFPASTSEPKSTKNVSLDKNILQENTSSLTNSSRTSTTTSEDEDEEGEKYSAFTQGFKFQNNEDRVSENNEGENEDDYEDEDEDEDEGGYRESDSIRNHNVASEKGERKQDDSRNEEKASTHSSPDDDFSGILLLKM
uniref:RNA-directed DNA polymerase, eukaryota, reverse transcriptase zinc-binding domain protein n=1 Tax=Tanacetum cinerariifolium TaxID=118510 RepID=A0A699GPY4_TANCI|nr:RNA-directed DNA polymerase, eukaryota, reverse transcriptase zinc-binding domain protein [Tanacetum cinerariifolium]